MTFRWAFSTNAFTRVGVEEACARIAACGYRGVEIMADVPHAFPARFGAVERGRLRDRVRELGLRVSNVNAFMMYGVRDCYFPAFTEEDGDARAARLAHSREAMHLARDLGASSVSIEPGGPVDGRRLQGPPIAGWRPVLRGERAWNAFLDAVRDLAVLGERLHVDVLVEPEPGLLLESPKEFARLMDDLQGSYPRVGLNFDVGHFYCVGEDPAALVPRLAEWTRHYHVEDIASTRVHRHLLPGEGAIDLPRFLRAVEATGYDGFLTVELYPYQEEPETVAREALRRLSGAPPAEVAPVGL